MANGFRILVLHLTSSALIWPTSFLEPEAFDLVHAGLVLEYVEWPLLVPRVASALKPGGVLSVVPQSPSATSPAVTPTPFVSLRSLESLFRFVEPEALVTAAHGAGLTVTSGLYLTEAVPGTVWRHMALTLTTDERTELERRVRSLKIRAEDARRARVILMLANGDSYSTIEATVPCYRDYINRWRRRFLADRLDGLRPRYRGQPPTILTPTMEARILAKTQQPPPDGSTHWSTRKLGRVLKIHHNLVAKAWQRAGLQPHRFERYMQSDDPDFEPKAADVIGLYVNPPDHAAVFAVDEKTAIQALDRLDPVLPLSPGRAERHGFEYYRHGTLSLFAALNTQSGEVLGQTVPRHTSAAFVDFLGDIVASEPKRRAIHVIADNLSTHKTQAVRTFLLEHPNVRLHFTPTYSSWLNQSNSGFRRSSETCSRAASLRPSPTWLARSVDISIATTKPRSRSAGPIATRPVELVVLQ